MYEDKTTHNSTHNSTTHNTTTHHVNEEKHNHTDTLVVTSAGAGTGAGVGAGGTSVERIVLREIGVQVSKGSFVRINSLIMNLALNTFT